MEKQHWSNHSWRCYSISQQSPPKPHVIQMKIEFWFFKNNVLDQISTLPKQKAGLWDKTQNYNKSPIGCLPTAQCVLQKEMSSEISSTQANIYHNRRKFRSQTSDNMDRWKAEQGGGREKRKIRRKKSKKKEDADARKSRKVAIHCVFPMIWGSGGSKSRLAKAAGAEPAGQMRDEKLHAIVARSTFPSQNVQNTPGADHFWKLRCRKSARHCGTKRVSKWKCTKHTMIGPLLAVEMSKKCTPLWREAHFEVKMYKTHHGRSTFGSWNVEKVHAVVARSTFPSQNVQSTSVSDEFWKLRCRKSARRCGAKHFLKSKC